MANDNEYLDQVEAGLSRLILRAENEPCLRFAKNLKLKYTDSHIYLVGGVVRDEILGNDSTDYDLLIEDLDQTKVTNFLKLNGRILGGSDLLTGVYKFLPKNTDTTVDIALSRFEKYETESRNPTNVDVKDVTVVDDLSRRDFTINAIAVEIFSDKKLNYVAFNNAIFDIKNRIIRAVDNPSKRFNEDPLRILRAVRFACKLNFLIERKTLAAIKSLSGTINQNYVDKNHNVKRRVSYERIQKEIVIGMHYNAARFINILDESNLLGEIFPEVERLKKVEQSKEYHSEGNVFSHTLLTIANIPNNSSVYVKLAGLFHDIGKFDATKVDESGKISAHGHELISGKESRVALKRLKFSNEFSEQVVWLVENHMRIYSFFEMSSIKRYKLVNHPLFNDLITLAMADNLATVRLDGYKNMDFYDQINNYLSKTTEINAPEARLLVNGNDVIDCVEKSGLSVHENCRQIGFIKDKINELYFDGKLKNKEEAFKLIKKYLKDAKENRLL